MNTEKILKSLEHYGPQYQSHTGEGLISHLKGTQSILARWDSSTELCHAGLCHSVYGTESYNSLTVPLSARAYLQDTIGEKAENLVYLFGAHQKKSLWMNLGQEHHRLMVQDRFKKDIVRISFEEFRDLVTLTLANLLEQRDRAPEESKFIRKEDFLAAKDFLPVVAYEDFKKAYWIV